MNKNYHDHDFGPIFHLCSYTKSLITISYKLSKKSPWPILVVPNKNYWVFPPRMGVSYSRYPPIAFG